MLTTTIQGAVYFNIFRQQSEAVKAYKPKFCSVSVLKDKHMLHLTNVNNLCNCTHNFNGDFTLKRYLPSIRNETQCKTCNVIAGVKNNAISLCQKPKHYHRLQHIVLQSENKLSGKINDNTM